MHNFLGVQLRQASKNLLSVIIALLETTITLCRSCQMVSMWCLVHHVRHHR